MAPVFALVLDEDLPEATVTMYPELYRELQKGRPLSPRTFCACILKSVYQGGILMILGVVLFASTFQNVVAITFTALILTEVYHIAFLLVAFLPCPSAFGGGWW